MSPEAKGNAMTERRFYLQTSTGSDVFRLHIEDDISGETLVDIKLDAKQAYDFLRGGTMHVNGGQSPHLDRVGKQMINESFEVPREILQPLERGEYLQAAETWAREAHPNWEQYEPRRNNSGGANVVVRRWVEDSTCGVTDEENRCTLPAGHDGNHADGYIQWGA